MQVALAFDVAAQLRDATGHIATRAVDAALGLAQRGDALRRQGVHGRQRLALASRRERPGHHLLQGDVLEQAADHVEHFVRAERVANGLQLLEQPRQHAAFAGAGGDQVGDGDVPGLAVAVDAAHALLQAGRVPRDVVVGHAGAELQVDAFAGGVRGDAEAGAIGLAELFYLRFPLAPVHAAVNLGDVAGVAQPLQAPHQVVQRVAVLGEHQPLLRRCRTLPARPSLAAGSAVFQHLVQLHELGLAALVDRLPRHAAQAVQRLHFRVQVFNGHGHHRAQRLGLELLVSFVRLAFPVVVLRAMRVEVVLAPIQTTALARKFLQRRLARLQIRRRAFQPFDAPVEGTQQRPTGTGQPALKHAKRQLRGAAIGERLAEGAAQVVRGGVVEGLLAGAQVVAERGADALAIQRAALQIHHLLLGAAQEVARAGLRREAAARLAGGEGVRVQQPPQVVIGRILAHVRRGGEQQQVPAPPRQAAVVAPRRGAAGQRLGQLIAARLGGAVVNGGGGQLVRFVEHHQVVGRRVGTLQPGEGGRVRQGVQGDDDPVTGAGLEGVTGPGVLPGDDAKAQPEQRAQLAFPVAHQAGRRHHQHATDAAAGEHLAHGQAGHDGFAGAGVVGQQEAQRVLQQHVFVHRDALVGERIDAGDLAGEGGVELVAERQAVRLGHGEDGARIACEVQRRGRGSAEPASEPPGMCSLAGGELLFQLPQLGHRQRARLGLPGFPAQHGERRHQQPLRELLLREPEALAQLANVRAVERVFRRAHGCQT